MRALILVVAAGLLAACAHTPEPDYRRDPRPSQTPPPPPPPSPGQA